MTAGTPPSSLMQRAAPLLFYPNRGLQRGEIGRLRWWKNVGRLLELCPHAGRTLVQLGVANRCVAGDAKERQVFGESRRGVGGNHDPWVAEGRRQRTEKLGSRHRVLSDCVDCVEEGTDDTAYRLRVPRGEVPSRDEYRRAEVRCVRRGGEYLAATLLGRQGELGDRPRGGVAVSVANR